jgi:hypothetical protein
MQVGHDQQIPTHYCRSLTVLTCSLIYKNNSFEISNDTAQVGRPQVFETFLICRPVGAFRNCACTFLLTFHAYGILQLR